MGTDLREFCLRWNNHHNTLVSVLDSLLERERLVDVTLAAEGQFINVHRFVLFACSQYFEDMLSQQPDKAAVIFLKDVRYADLKALVNYMYKGEVNVAQDELENFLHTAQALKIKGLIDKREEQHKKMTPVPKEVVPLIKGKARMNGPKLPQPNNTLHCDVQLGSPEEEDDGVMVAEMESEDNFVSVDDSKQEDGASDFGDDQFEATENWSSQETEEDGWNNSLEETSATPTTPSISIPNAINDAEPENWTPEPENNSAGPENTFAGPSRPKRFRSKSNLSLPANKGEERARMKRKRPASVSSKKQSIHGPIKCPKCGRCYHHSSSFYRHKNLECSGKRNEKFECGFQLANGHICPATFSRKDNLKAHVNRLHSQQSDVKK